MKVSKRWKKSKDNIESANYYYDLKINNLFNIMVSSYSKTSYLQVRAHIKASYSMIKIKKYSSVHAAKIGAQRYIKRLVRSVD